MTTLSTHVSRSEPLTRVSARLSVPNTLRAGLVLALATAVISGFSIFINSYAANEFHSASTFSSMKNTVVGAALLLLFLPRGGTPLRRLKSRQVVALLALGVVGGSVPFILFFEGLSRAGSANAAFVQKTLFVWVALLAVPLLRERLGRAQIGAIALLVVAQWMIGAPTSLRPDTGLTMVFAATLLWAVEVIIAKKILAEVGGQLGATARMAFGAVILFGYVVYKGDIGDFGSLSMLEWTWLLVTAAILLAYVTTWYAAMERAPATAVTCVLAVGAPITAALNVISGKGAPTGDQLIGFALVLTAAAVLVWLPATVPASSQSVKAPAP
jgi:drug/metabolite transporter (DMT)-like permease